MGIIFVECDTCGIQFKRTTDRYNEAIKNGWKFFCCQECLILSRAKRKEFSCSNCGNIFYRTLGEIKKSKFVYCSRSCAACVNNTKYPKNPGVRKNCEICGVVFVGNKIFCSAKCKFAGQVIASDTIKDQIKGFYKTYGRIPMKCEFPHYHAARNRFGSWNKAIIAAGFKPNPVMFANKWTAIDGHICDSLAEKIIDDWLARREISHETKVPYPEDNKLKVDFVIKGYWIEFFGLSGELKRYDELKRRKISLARKYNLDLIALYPKDLFPKGKLNEKLGFLID